MFITGIWKTRFSRLVCTAAVLLLAVILYAAGAAFAGEDLCAGTGIMSPRILDCGQSPDETGVYVLYSDAPDMQAVYNPGFHYAIEYDGSVADAETDARKAAWDLQVHVYDTRSGRRLYTADLTGMLREAVQGYTVFPDLSIRVTQAGREYLVLEGLQGAGADSVLDGEIVMDLAYGELQLYKGTETEDLSVINRDIRRTGWLSSLYTNLLEINGYAGAQAIARPGGFILGYAPAQGGIDASHLLRFFLPEDRRSWEQAAYVTCVFRADTQVRQGQQDQQDQLIQAFFGSPDHIRWDGAVIYKNASVDGQEHAIRSIEDFYRWYRYDGEGRRRGAIGY